MSRNPRPSPALPSARLSSPEEIRFLRRTVSPQPGEEVILNNVVSARIDGLPTSEHLAEVLQQLFREGYGQEPENS
jgi:hypothetical protein